jgi:hypothetical protein
MPRRGLESPQSIERRQPGGHFHSLIHDVISSETVQSVVCGSAWSGRY